MGKEKTPNYALKAIFSTASLNGSAAVLMSLATGSVPATALYAYGVIAGVYNKYKALKYPNEEKDLSKKGALTRIFRDPSITARVLMAAATYNFIDAGIDVFTGPADEAGANALRMVGWSFGFLGDNALRRLDSVNFRQGRTLAKENVSKIKETFNALTANPTLFYNGASMAFTLAALSRQPEGMFSSLEGGIGLAALGLVLYGVGHAVRNTWKATRGQITTDKINDGVMNYCSSLSKALQSGVSFMMGNYALAVAQGVFTGSNIKLIYETRAALSKKDKNEMSLASQQATTVSAP